jgi:tight adherence protein C
MNAAQFVIGMGLMTLGLAYALISSATGELSTRAFILAIILPGGIGYYLPKYWVERRIQTRQTQIIEGFPDSLDLMLVCVEAGQSLDQSILRVSREIRAGYPALADEFEIVGQEVKAGKDRVSVLKDMSERAGVPDVSSFVTVLVQSATFGTSIADALRVYAAEMRDKRVMRAEEKANVLPTKLTLGTMMFTVPPLMIILIGPSIHSIVQTFAMMNK